MASDPPFAKIYPRDENGIKSLHTITGSCHRQYIQEAPDIQGNIAFQLSMSNLSVNKNNLGWKMGRTSDVNLLTGEVNEALTAHALLCFDMRSGLINLCGVDEKYQVCFFDVKTSIWRLLETGQSRCFSTRMNIFKLQKFVYAFVYEDLGKQARELHHRTLNHMFKKLNLIPPHPRIFSIPGPDPDIELHDIVGAGGFGTVFAGIHNPTGKPVAVKQIDIRRGADYEALKNEIRVATSFPVGSLTWHSIFIHHANIE